MFNKIRNLFNKLKRNKESELDIEDEFFTDIEEESSEFSSLEPSDEDLDLPPPPMPEQDLHEQTDSFVTDQIDLEGGKLSLKDKLNLTIENTKNKLGRINIKKPKKLTAKSAKEITRKIKLPKSLSSVKINWLNLQNDFFSPQLRNKIHKFFQYSFLVLITFTLGKTLGIILTGSRDYKDLPKNISLDLDKEKLLKTADILQVTKAKLFKTEAKKVEDQPNKPKVQSNLACVKADGKSRLPIKLINTVVLQDSIKSIASVQVRSTNLLQELRVGENIDNMAKIGKIERSKLIIKNLKTGTCESIENEDDKQDYTPIAVLSPKKSKTFKKQLKKIKGIESDGNKFVIEKDFMKSKMKNIGDVLSQARGIQINNPDGSISFKIVEVQPGGMFAYLGIEDNDIITQINGQPINDLNAVMSLFSKLQGQGLSKLGLNIKRGGVDTPQQYSFK